MFSKAILIYLFLMYILGLPDITLNVNFAVFLRLILHNQPAKLDCIITLWSELCVCRGSYSYVVWGLTYMSVQITCGMWP